MSRSISVGARSILDRAKRPMAVAALVGSIGFAGVNIAATAGASPASGTLVTCDGYGSGDVCWWNPNSRHSLDTLATSTQYNRDQVCAKARVGSLDGPVAEPDRTGCAPGTNHQSVQFDGTAVLKHGYGYWAGNGGAIQVRTRATY